LPARERIADPLGELGLLADEAELLAQPGFEVGDNRTAPFLPRDAAFVGGSATDIVLYSVELGDPCQHLAGNWGRTGRGQFVEGPANVRPAEGERHAALVGQRAIGAVTVDLQDASEAVEMRDRPLGLAVGCIDIGHARRVGSVPWAVVAGVGPELPRLGLATTGIEHWRGRLVGEEFR
jgi:hypothetical protein